MTKDELIGVYRQLGADTVRADGTAVEDKPRNSQIMYSADGYMSVVSTPVERPRLSDTRPNTNLDALSPAERADAATGIVCYAGRYAFKDADTLLHHVEIALNPNLIGQAVVVTVTLSLILHSVTAPVGVRLLQRHSEAMSPQPPAGS